MASQGDIDAAVLRERLEGMAYLALWQLRDLDPDAEPGYFRKTRLDLHRRIDEADGGEPPTPPPVPERTRHLAVVPR